MKMNKRLISLCLSLLLVFMLLPVSALAAGRIDLDQDVGLTITRSSTVPVLESSRPVSVISK